MLLSDVVKIPIIIKYADQFDPYSVYLSPIWRKDFEKKELGLERGLVIGQPGSIVSMREQKTFIVDAPSGSGKSAFALKKASALIVDGDVLYAEEVGWPSHSGWFLDRKLLSETHASINKWILEKKAETINHDRIIFMAAPKYADAHILIDEDIHKMRVRTRSPGDQPTDWDQILVSREETVRASKGRLVFTTFDEAVEHFATPLTGDIIWGEDAYRKEVGWPSVDNMLRMKGEEDTNEGKRMMMQFVGFIENWKYRPENKGKIMIVDDPYVSDYHIVPDALTIMKMSAQFFGTRESSNLSYAAERLGVYERVEAKKFANIDEVMSEVRSKKKTAWERATTRAGIESTIATMIRFRNQLAVLRGSMGSIFTQSPFVRRMKNYLDHIATDRRKGENSTGFYGGRGSTVVIDGPDILAPVRWHMMLEAASIDYGQRYWMRPLPGVVKKPEYVVIPSGHGKSSQYINGLVDVDYFLHLAGIFYFDPDYQRHVLETKNALKRLGHVLHGGLVIAVQDKKMVPSGGRIIGEFGLEEDVWRAGISERTNILAESFENYRGTRYGSYDSLWDAVRIVVGDRTTVHNMYVEAFDYMFEDPYVNCLKLKKLVSGARDLAFALTPIGKGIHPVWQMQDDAHHGMSTSHVTFNDAMVYEVKKDDIEADMEELGGVCPITRIYFESIIRMEVNPFNMWYVVNIMNLPSVVGFIRGFLPSAFRAQANLNPAPVNIPAGPIIETTYYEWARSAIQKGTIPRNMDAWRRQVIGKLTSKSSGMEPQPIKFMTVEVVDGVRIKKLREVKDNTKVIVFAVLGNSIFNAEKFSKTIGKRDTPNFNGSRYQLSRRTRAVNIFNLYDYAWEVPLADALQSEQIFREIFSVGDDAGRSITDHRTLIASSSLEGVWDSGLDYSQFDSTILERLRRFKLAGLLRAFEHEGLADTVLEYNNGIAITWRFVINQLHENRSMAWYEFKTLDWIGRMVTQMGLDQNHSGEKGTLELNGGVNYAVKRDIADGIRDVANFKSLEAGIQGDDSREAMIFDEPLDVEKIKKIFKVIDFRVTRNGLLINAVKTGFGQSHASYLQKDAFFGTFVPRRDSIQRHTKERKPETKESESVIGLFSVFSEFVSRGGNHDFNNIMMRFSASLLASVASRAGDNAFFVNLPSTWAYVPISMGGGGGYPGSLAGANKDAAMYLLYNEAEKAEVDRVAFIINSKARESLDAIVKDILDSGSVNGGIHAMRELQHAARGKNAEKANEELKRINGRGVALPYSSLPYVMISQSIRDSPKFQKINREMGSAFASDVAKNIEEAKTYGMEPKVVTIGGLKGNPRLVAKSILNDRIDVCCDLEERFKDPMAAALTAGQVGRILVVILKDGMGDINVSETDEEDIFYYDPGDNRSIMRISKLLSKEIPSNNRSMPKAMDAKFSWMRMLEYDWGDELEVVEKLPAVGGLDSEFADLLRRVGSSGSENDGAPNLAKIFRPITSDPQFPSFYTDQQMFDAVTASDIIGNETKMALALEAMGADPARATVVVESLQGQAGRFVMESKVKSFSTRDQMLSYMRKDITNVERICSVPNLKFVQLRNRLLALSLTMLLIDGGKSVPSLYRGVPRRCHLMILGHKYLEVIDELKGNFGEQSIPSEEIFSGFVFR
jgi:hypothetical protein